MMKYYYRLLEVLLLIKHMEYYFDSVVYISAVNDKLLLNTVKYSTFILHSLPLRLLKDLSKILEKSPTRCDWIKTSWIYLFPTDTGKDDKEGESNNNEGVDKSRLQNIRHKGRFIGVVVGRGAIGAKGVKQPWRRHFPLVLVFNS